MNIYQAIEAFNERAPYVHIDHVDLSGLIYIGGHCFDAGFKHRWPRKLGGNL